MRFRTYILISAASLWFIIGSLFMYRSGWGLDKAKFHKGAVIEFGLLEFDPYEHKMAFTFKLSGSENRFGIYQKRNKKYVDFSNFMSIGDTISIYYNDWRQVKGNTYLQVVDMSSKKHVFVDYKTRNSRDRIIAYVLYGISLILGILGWALNKKRFSEPENL